MLFETSDIFKAIKHKSLETPVKTLKIINSGKEDVNNKSPKDETYLHYIAHCYTGDKDEPALVPVVFQLSNAGIDVNACDGDGNTALHIAAKSNGTRKLIRVLLMIGIDPQKDNTDRQTALKLAKDFPDNVHILKFFAPGLWDAVEKNSNDTVQRLLSNWVRIDETRNGTTVQELAAEKGNEAIIKGLKLRENTVKLVHYALAGDRQRLRPFFKMSDVNINTLSTSYIDAKSGDFVNCPLIGEAALLALTAIVRKLIRKKADLNYDVDKTPLYLYVLQNIQPEKSFYEMLEILLYKFDFTNKKEETHAILDAAYNFKLPIKVLRLMAANGLDLFATDDEGHFLRDRILIKNATANPKVLETELEFVDKIVVDMAENGCMGLLQELVERSYEYFDVKDTEGNSVRRGLSKTKGDIQAEKFLSNAVKVQKVHREVSHVISIGHMAQFQMMVTTEVAKVKDKFGRSLLYKTVLFERRHMLRHLLKICPNVAVEKDKMGRSPLYWACAQEESGDMEAALKALGCSMEETDRTGDTPANVKALTDKEKIVLLEKERSRDYGLDTYLFYKYLDIKEAIRQNDVTGVEEIRGAMYKDIPTKDITRRMLQSNPPQKCILQFAIEAKRDAIAKFLLTMGMEWNVKYKDGKEEASLLEIAKAKDMKAVVKYVEYQIEQEEEHKRLIKKLKNRGVVKTVKSKTAVKTDQSADTNAVNSETNGNSVDGEDDGSSKTCNIQ